MITVGFIFLYTVGLIAGAIISMLVLTIGGQTPRPVEYTTCIAATVFWPITVVYFGFKTLKSLFL